MKFVFVFTLLALSLVTARQNCWKTAYGRGVGTVPDSCPAG